MKKVYQREELSLVTNLGSIVENKSRALYGTPTNESSTIFRFQFRITVILGSWFLVPGAA